MTEHGILTLLLSTKNYSTMSYENPATEKLHNAFQNEQYLKYVALNKNSALTLLLMLLICLIQIAWPFI